MTLLSFLLLVALHGFGSTLLGLIRVPHCSLRFSLSYLIGATSSTLLFFVFLVLGFDIYRSFAVVLMAVGIGAMHSWSTAGYRNDLKKIVDLVLPRNRVEQTLFLLILFILCYVTVMNLFWPHTDWDAMTLYDYRAKVLLEVGSLQPLFTSIQDIYLVSYPWHTSLLLLQQYMLGSWNGMVMFSLLTISLVLGFFSLIESMSGRLHAYIASLAVVTVPMIFTHTMIAYTNFPYMVYWGLGVCCLLSWISTQRFDRVQLGTLLIAGSLWIRQSEPFWMIAVLLVVYGCIVLRQWKAGFWLLPILLVWRGWNLYVHGVLKQVLPSTSAELATYEKGGSLGTSLLAFLEINRWAAVFEHLLTYAAPLWGGWIFIVFLLLISQQKSKALIPPILSVLACIGAIVLGTYLFATNTYWNEIVDSFQRLLIFAFPVFIYSVFTTHANPTKHYGKK